MPRGKNFSGEKSLTNQELTGQTSMSFLMRGLNKHSVVRKRPQKAPDVYDFSKSLVDSVIEARIVTEKVAKIAPAIRRKFKNDPDKVIEFCKNPENYHEALALGLINRNPQLEIQLANQEEERVIKELEKEEKT